VFYKQLTIYDLRMEENIKDTLVAFTKVKVQQEKIDAKKREKV